MRRGRPLICVELRYTYTRRMPAIQQVLIFWFEGLALGI